MTNPTPVWGPDFIVDSQDWLASKFGTDATDSATLDPSKFTAATHYPQGFLPAGLPLTRDTTTGRWGPAAANATVCDGHLMHAYTPAQLGQQPKAWDRVAVLTVGKVVAAKIPVVPTARAPHVIYV